MNGAVTVTSEIRRVVDEFHSRLEKKLDRDVVAIIGPIVGGLDSMLRDVIEVNQKRRTKLAVVLQTPGGVVEVAERIVNVVRHFYAEVAFIIPDSAHSAGTVLAMSGDDIFMDYYSCLGPIDPQVFRDGKLVPALSYLVQYNRLIAKSKDGTMTTGEFALLNKFDLAELHVFEEARELTMDLLVKWLTTYKFKDWKTTETRGFPVDSATRKQRAHEIAQQLSDHEKWHTHGRGIPMRTIQEELKLRITDYGKDPELKKFIHDYFELLTDFSDTNGHKILVHPSTLF